MNEPLPATEEGMTNHIDSSHANPVSCDHAGSDANRKHLYSPEDRSYNPPPSEEWNEPNRRDQDNKIFPSKGLL